MPLVSPAEAARLLQGEQPVGLPTETVYGLAASGLSAAAIAAVYRLKGRPPTHPLILHVLDDPDAHAVMDDRAWALVAAFWPGPLTLVLPRRPHLPDALTGGFPTVAVRSPAHPVAREVLARAGLPLAAPSANRFGRVSPTTAGHVLAEFPELPVVDGGPCAHGVESTILDLSGPEPALLRPGAVPVEELERHVGPVRLGGSTPAPGTLPSHYAPRAAVVVAEDVEAEAQRLRARGYRVATLPALPPEAYARGLYARLRELDAQGVEVIVAAPCEARGVGLAVNDRLRRAGAGREPPIG